MANILHIPLNAIENGQVKDLSGNNYHGTVQNGASIVDDPIFGKVMQFDGTNDRVELTDANTLKLKEHDFLFVRG